MRRRRRRKGPYKFHLVEVEKRKFLVQGYERFFLKDLSTHGLAVGDISPNVPRIRYDMGRGPRTYIPDFYVPRLNLLIEIKSPWTMSRDKRRNRRKWAAAREAGYELRVIVYGRDGRVVG